ncbi:MULTISPECIES: oligosaccharide flippase family protein [Comamonas]|uniref:Polysaccharide biosynthesis protein n=1 Tax=Comamonas testosteroni TaxID=285 RepID=A0A096HDF0_COMTE|nr:MULTISPECIES: oligosaccharide flippase family protein [Comamonas]KGH26897.1 hypothetical protein P353_20540 [Comamonas testosteroni]MPT10524.1 hypothetical protein [Comamonas sp.]
MNKIILRNFIVLNIERLLTIGAGVFVSGILARSLGTDLFGSFQYALSIVAIFMAISFFCGAEVIVPRIVECNDNFLENIIIATAFWIRLLFGIIAFIAFMVFWRERVGINYFAVLGIPILFKEAFSIAIAWFQAKSKNSTYSTLIIISNCIKISVIGFLYFFDVYDYKYYLTVLMLDGFLVYGFIFLFFLKINKFSIFIFDKKIAVELLKKSFPFGLAVLSMYAFKKIDRVFIENYIGTQEFSFYSAAAMIYDNLMVLGSISIIVLAPKLIYSQSNVNLLYRNFFKITLFVIALYGIIVVFVFFLSESVVRIIFGSNYVAAVPYIYVFMAPLLLCFLDECINVVFNKMKNGWVVFLKWGVSLLVSILFLTFEGERYGAFAGPISMILGYMSCLLIGIYFLIRIRFYKLQ